MEEEQREKQREEKRKQENIKIVRGVVTAIESIFKRQRDIEDICLRNCLFVDKLSMTLDVMMAMLNTQTEEDWPKDLKEQISNISKNMNTDLQNLMNWVRSPTYDPAHPFCSNQVKSTTAFAKNLNLN